MAQAARIFVSHAHEDNAWCRAFVQALRQAGADMWYDEHNLGYGTLGEEIERELRARPIFLVILSPAAIHKPWVRREVEAAISLKDEEPERIVLPMMAEVPLFWRGYKRVAGPGDAGLTATETVEAAWERGKGLRAQRRPAEALAAYERAIALDPNNV